MLLSGEKKIASKIESVIKADLAYLVSGNFWLSAGHAVSVLSSLALVLVLGRVLSESAYGDYKYVFAVAGVVESFGLNGMPTALIRSVSRGYDWTLLAGFKESLKCSFLIVLSASGTGLYYLAKGNGVYAASFFIMAACLPVLRSMSLSQAYLSARKNFKAQSVYAMIVNVCSSLALIMTVLCGGNLLAIVSAYFAANLATHAAILLSTLRRYPPRNGIADPEAVGYAGHLSAVGILNTVADRLDSLLVFFYLGASSLAVYSLAVAVPEQIKGFSKNVQSLALPKFSERSAAEIKERMLLRIGQVMLIMAPVVCVYVAAAPYLYRFFLHGYSESVLYSQAYAVSLVFVTAAMLPLAALRALAAKSEIYRLNIAASILLIALLFFGVRSYGIFGAIAAIAITRAFRLAYGTILVFRLA